jgi:hypothetical protein
MKVKIIRSQILPTKDQQQFGENQPVFTTLTERFNDWNISSGFIIEENNEILVKAGIS